MSYLTRVFLNPQRRQTRRLLSDPQALHAAVLGGLTSQPVTERVLWRVDADQPLRPHLLVLTRSAPSWEHLVEQAGWPSADDPSDPQVLVRSYEPLLQRLAEGDEFAFRLTANPVSATRDVSRLSPAQQKRFGPDGPAKSRLVAHRSTEHQIGWLTDRADRIGIEIPQARSAEAMNASVPDVRIAAKSRITFSKKKGASPVSLQLATFEGRLVVRDVDALRVALLDGVGRAKAYGCGLLTLAPLASGG